MDWSNERYVRMYTRDTESWLLLTWQARALFFFMVRKVDRAGVLETKRGARGVAVLVGMPPDVVELALPELLEDGCVTQHATGYLIPNFLAAQEAPQSDAQRQRESREKRRALAGGVTKRDEQVTKRDAMSQAVTPSDPSGPASQAGLTQKEESSLSRVVGKPPPPRRADWQPAAGEENAEAAAAAERTKGVDLERERKVFVEHNAFDSCGSDHDRAWRGFLLKARAPKAKERVWHRDICVHDGVQLVGELIGKILDDAEVDNEGFVRWDRYAARLPNGMYREATIDEEIAAADAEKKALEFVAKVERDAAKRRQASQAGVR